MKGETKLTPTMVRVLRLMAEGWELSVRGGIRPVFMLQRGGTGKGGPAEDVNANTVSALGNRGLIYPTKRGFPYTIYGLTDKGRNALASALPEAKP